MTLARKTNVVGTAKTNNPTLDSGAICRYCGKTEWKFLATYETPFTANKARAVTNALPMRKEASNEIRCSSCGRKACLENVNYIRTLAVFHDIKEREFEKL